MAKIQRALVTVEDKTGVAEFAQRLADLEVEIIATGGTGRLLRESGIEALDVSEYTGFPEILEGWLRTLHPKLVAGLVARRDQAEHLRDLEQHGIRTIDMVVVNLYPFLDTISQPGLPMMRAIDNIDVAGPTLVRAAAKNYTHVAVVTNPAEYDSVAMEMEHSGGELSEETHFQLALEAFRHTARYDMMIARQMTGIHGPEEGLPATLLLELEKRMDLPRRETRGRPAAFYVEKRQGECSIGNSCLVNGQEPSFADVLDLDAGMALGKELDRPAAVFAAQGQVCGAGTADDLPDAFERALALPGLRGGRCGLVLNRPLDPAVAAAIVSAGRGLVSAVAAPGQDEQALDVFRQQDEWRDLPVLETLPLAVSPGDERALGMTRVGGGFLVKHGGPAFLMPEDLQEPGRTADVRLAWACARHAPPIAAALVTDEALTGLSHGCPSVEYALKRCLADVAGEASGSVAAVNRPLEGREQVERLAEAGVQIVVQPEGGGSEEEIVQAADRLGSVTILTARPQPAR